MRCCEEVVNADDALLNDWTGASENLLCPLSAKRLFAKVNRGASTACQSGMHVV